MRTLFIKNSFFIGLAVCAILFFLSAFISFLYPLVVVLFLAFTILSILDLVLLYRHKTGVEASRICPDKFSNGDYNDIIIHLRSFYQNKISLRVIDELPFIFQIRDKFWERSLGPREQDNIHYQMRPTKRGLYNFGNLNVFVSNIIGFFERRYQFDANQDVRVYPSFLDLKKHELIAFSNRLTMQGNKRQRRLGNTMEFEQIKPYVAGDDPRTLNWKASARVNELMVNQYQDERSQQVYSIIDKGRLMKMPFNELSLLDYAINASLSISNIALKKDDRVGLITYSNKLSSVLPASKRRGQMQKILEVLHNQKTHYLESNFELLNAYVSRKINQRSLLLLFTNFESKVSFDRQLRYFKLLSRKHLLVVIFFKNTEVELLQKEQPQSMREVYVQTIANEFTMSKELIVTELKRNGILAILTRPEDLTVNTINTYIDIKKRRLL